MERYRASYYNMRVPNGAVTLLFNGVSGALLALDRKLAQGWAPFLGNQRDHAAGTGYNSWNPQPIYRHRFTRVHRPPFAGIC